MKARWWAAGVACLGLAAAGIWVATGDSSTPSRAAADGTSTTIADTTPATLPAMTTSTSTTSTTITTSTSTTTSTTSTSTTTGEPTPPTISIAPGQWITFDQTIADATTNRGDAAVSIAVVRDGVLLHAFAFGMENPLTGTAATPDTRFRLASISKLLTANAVLQLVQRGDIELDEPFLHQLGRDGDATDPLTATITVRQLLNHTSGFPKAFSRYFSGGATDWRQAAEQSLRSPLQAVPGTAWQYSNTNYVLLGLLVEHVTGKSFEQAIDELVVDPLGATGMRMAGTFDARPGDAIHASTPGRNYMETLGPAGAWIGTAPDVARLLDVLDPDDLDHGWHPLTEATLAAMKVPQTVMDPKNNFNYGLGLLLYPGDQWGHTGTIEQAHTLVVHRPDNLTVAILISGEVPLNTDKLIELVQTAVVAGAIG